jgi:hypothetical protein
VIIESLDDEFISEISEGNQSWIHVVVDELFHNKIAGHFNVSRSGLDAIILESVNQISFGL